MKKINIKSIVFISVLMFALASCGKQNKPETEGSEEVLPYNIVELRDDQIKMADIQLDTIGIRVMSGTLKVSGTISAAPQNTAIVSMPYGGIVKSTTLLPGNSVVKGQALATIENPEFIDIQQSYLETKSKLDYVEADYNRQSELYKNDVTSKKNMEMISSEYRNLKVQLGALEQKLSIIGIKAHALNEKNISKSVVLTAPISGYIKTVNVSIGKSVLPSDALFEIVNTSKLFLQLTLFEKDASKVLLGQKIRFFINDEAEEHTAQIYQTAKSIDADKTYKVYATVNSTCKNVLPGMYVNATIESNGEKVQAVPAESIVNFEDKDYIFVFEKNKEEDGKPFTEYRMIQVKKGITDDGYTGITLPDNFNLKEAKIVVKGAYNLLSAKKNAGEMAC